MVILSINVLVEQNYTVLLYLGQVHLSETEIMLI